MNLVNPLKKFGGKLCSVQNPAAYTGGEIGEIKKPHTENDNLFNFAIAFPDLYTIGMSNQAIKIIYNALNKSENIRCERVFCPTEDFEKLLKETDTPLYTLETGMPLNELDMLGFSIGYELGITSALNILENGRIPLLKKDRTENDPIIMAGGVGATNPAVFSPFFDGVFIGEAEGGMFELFEKLAEMKKNGASKKEILKEFAKHPAVWTENMTVEECGHTVAKRAVYEKFGMEETIYSYMPLPNVKPVQDHGVVEIMRGCPNGCRFCHAGIYYRPQRIKPKEQIISDVDHLVNDAGYREISLTSLSSADYPDVGELLEELNRIYKNKNVSFQMPSLKVNSLTLPILQQISEVRKSGLTFAVETPDEAWQLSLNKEVYAQHLVALINEARKYGWNKAKFYFMVGLPFSEKDGKTEEKVIVDFLLELQEKTGIHCNVNVGTFIPKPHTPYQWVRQISPEESEKKLRYIRENLPRGKFHVGTHDIATSFIEGLLSRGDRRAGMVIYNAYKKGCRLDAWEDHLRANLPLWKEAFEEADYDVRNEILRQRDFDEVLPWDSVSLGPGKNYYLKEWKKHEEQTLTSPCSEKCSHNCGVCHGDTKVSLKPSNNVYKNIQIDNKFEENLPRPKCNIPILYRILFSIRKNQGGEFLSHLSIVEIFNRAFLKSTLPVVFTAGFNPLPRLEFATTLSIGIISDEEIASVIMYENVSEEEFISSINKSLPESLKIEKAFIFPVSNLRKRESLSSLLWGSIYKCPFADDITKEEITSFFESQKFDEFKKNAPEIDFEISEKYFTVKLPFAKDRAFRNTLEEYFDRKLYEIVTFEKTETLAKSAANETVSYWSLYREIAEINAGLIAKM